MMIKMILAFIIIGLEIYSLLSVSGALVGKYKQGFVGWYTNLSNILVLLYFVLVLVDHIFVPIEIISNSVVALSVTMAIMMTFLIFHFILRKPLLKLSKEQPDLWQFYSIENLSLHYICPILTIVYWVVFANKDGLTFLTGCYWGILPVLYLIYANIRAKLNYRFLNGERYPYLFMNIDVLGFKKVAINIVAILAIFLALGMLVAQIGVWINLL